MKRTTAGLFVCALMALIIPAHADAQGIKGLIKKKVTGEKTEQKAATDPRLRDFQLGAEIAGKTEISELTIDAFTVGIKTEIKQRLEFKKLLATFKTQEQLRVCGQQMAQNAEVMKLIMESGNIPESYTTEQAQKHIEKKQAEAAALITKKCGRSLDTEWPIHKRNERVAKIEDEGAEAFVAALTGPAPKRSGPAADESTVGFKPDKRMYWALKDILQSFCHAFKKGMIILDSADKTYKFSFSHPIPFSDFYDQKTAADLAYFCKMKISKYVDRDFSDDDLEDLSLEF